MRRVAGAEWLYFLFAGSEQCHDAAFLKLERNSLDHGGQLDNLQTPV